MANANETETETDTGTEHSTTLLHAGFVTHDVKQFILARPDGFEFEPGQGVELAIARGRWEEMGRPFTPTCPEDAPVLEFIIKEYPSGDGVTEKLHDLEPGTPLHLSDAFGSITWKGPGTFIAAGAGITPFLAIFRDQEGADQLEQCTLLFSNKTPADVIHEKELRYLLGDRAHFTCTRESKPGYDFQRIDRAYLQEKVDDFSQTFYLCGPPGFVEDVRATLQDLGAPEDQIVVEE